MVVDFDKLGCGIEKLVDTIADVIYGMFFPGVPFLVAFVGVTVIDFYLVLSALLIPNIIHVVCSVIFLVCTHFCYFLVIAIMVSRYEHLYDRIIVVPGCR